MWLFAIFLVVPLIEIALFITVGGWLTLWPTLALVLLTGVVGTMLMRWQGLKVLAELRGDLGQMRDPLSPLAHGALILIAGMLLLTPGFFTDSLGLLLMVPAVRNAVIGWVGQRVQVQAFCARPQGTWRDQPPGGTGNGAGPGGGPVIDGAYMEIDPEDGPKPPRGPSGWTRH
jgi:UPF0716 protein FxsA